MEALSVPSISTCGFSGNHHFPLYSTSLIIFVPVPEEIYPLSLILSLSKPEHLNVTTLVALSAMSSFVWGFLPRRCFLSWTQNLPKPDISKENGVQRKWCQTYTFDKASFFIVFVISFPNFLSFFCFNEILRLAWVTPDSLTPNRSAIFLSFLPL